jgi:class 3 adenylate cyclase
MQMAPAERKFAVLVFADLTGYTKLCEEVDPEQVVAALHPFMRSLQEAAEAEGGVICSTQGDGFLASFGAPVAVEDAPMRAVRAAHMMRALAASTRTDKSGIELPKVHTGIAAGEVLVLPGPTGHPHSLVGAAVNLAARLSDAAPPGEIYLDDQIHALVRHGVESREPMSLTLQGLDRSIRAWPLVDFVLPQDSASSVPFHGRTDSVAYLDAVLHEVKRTRRSSVVHVVGEAGIGKTRLIVEWLRQIAYPALVMNAAETRPAGLEDLVALLDPPTSTDEDRTARPEVTLTPSRTDTLPSSIASVRRLIAMKAIEIGHPFVVFIDNFERAEASLADFVEQVNNEPIDAPTILLLASRTDEDVVPRPGILALRGLREQEIQALAREMWPEISPEAASAVAERVNGHPLMAAQLLADLAEPNRDVHLSEVPTSLRLFVAARIDRLPASEKALLQRLSTCGPSFTTADVAAVSDAQDPPIAALVSRRLITPSGANFKFEHSVVHEVAYLSLPRRDRASLHKAHLARFSETDHHQRRFFHAARWAEAASVEGAAELAAAVQFALQEALHLAQELFRSQVRTAESVIREVRQLALEHAEISPLDAVQLLLLDARCLLEMWDYTNAEQVAAHSVRIAHEHLVPVPVRLDAEIVHAMALASLRRMHSARALLDDVILAAEQAGDDTRRGRALRVLAATWTRESFSQEVALCEESYAICARAGDRESAVATARYLAYLTAIAIAPVHARWRAIAEQTAPDDLWGRAMLARADAMRAIYQLDIDGADSAAQEAIKLGETLGAMDILGDSWPVLLDVATARGNHEGVETAVQAISTLAREGNNERLAMFLDSCVALGRLRSGSPAQAHEHLKRARLRCHQFGPGALSEVSYTQSLVAADQGNFANALSSLNDARAGTSDGPVALEVLLHRTKEARFSLAAGLAVSPHAIQVLTDECVSAGAPFLASYSRALADAARLAAGEVSEASVAIRDACIEEVAIRADNAALAAELRGEEAMGLWQHAAQTWAKLGYTVWLARAQARAGDRKNAERTLDLIDAADEGRAFALQR